MERQPRSSSSVTIPASTDGRKSATDKSKMSASLIIGAGRVRTRSMTRSKARLYPCTAKMARSSSWLETSGSGVPLTTASESSLVIRYPSIVVLWYASYCFAWRALPTSRASDNPGAGRPGPRGGNRGRSGSARGAGDSEPGTTYRSASTRSFHHAKARSRGVVRVRGGIEEGTGYAIEWIALRRMSEMR